MITRLGILLVVLGIIAWIVNAANWPKELAPECGTVAPFLFFIGLAIVVGVWLIERFLGRDVP